jgi:hypothetical protein
MALSRWTTKNAASTNEDSVDLLPAPLGRLLPYWWHSVCECLFQGDSSLPKEQSMPEEGPLVQEEVARLVAHFNRLLDDRVAEMERRLHGQITDLRREVALLARRVSDLENIEQREIGSLEERMSDLEEEDQTRG